MLVKGDLIAITQAWKTASRLKRVWRGAWAQQSGAKDRFLGFPKANSRLVPVCIERTSQT